MVRSAQGCFATNVRTSQIEDILAGNAQATSWLDTVVVATPLTLI
jgi:hypothetical protein